MKKNITLHKIQTDIEKNGGCFYMNCFKCHFEFCWSCLRPWSEHRDHWVCNRFEKSMKSEEFKTRLSKQKEAEIEIKKFSFYYEKYYSHSQGLDYVKRAIAKIDNLIELFCKETELSSVTMEFLGEALNIIAEMRRILMYSYVLGYYKSEKENLELFSFQQGALEQYCDKLQQLTEKKISDIKTNEVNNSWFFKYKSEVSNYFGVCRKYYQSFIETVKLDFH